MYLKSAHQQNYILNIKNKEFIRFVYIDFKNIYDIISKDFSSLGLITLETPYRFGLYSKMIQK